jgi:hypothetical protein
VPEEYPDVCRSLIGSISIKGKVVPGDMYELLGNLKSL